MNEVLFMAFVAALLIFLLCCLLMLTNFVYMDWNNLSHGGAIFFVIMTAITALAYWCFILKAAEVVRGILL